MKYNGVVNPVIEILERTITPDFKFDDRDAEFYIEATVVRDLSVEEEKGENLLNAIYDSLSQVKSPNFSLDLSGFELKNFNSSPAVRNLCTHAKSDTH